MRRSTPRPGSTREPSTARAGAWRRHGRLATTCSCRATASATRPKRRCARPTTASPPTAAAAGRYAWDATTASAAASQAVVHRRQRPHRSERLLAARVVERPDLTIDVRPELWWGSNTRPDAPYFNPQPERVRRHEASRRGTCSGGGTSGAFTRSSAVGRRVRAGGVPDAVDGSAGYEHILHLTPNPRCTTVSATPVASTTGARSRTCVCAINLGHRFDDAPARCRAHRRLVPCAGCPGAAPRPRRRPTRAFLSVVLHDVVDERA